MNFRYLAKTIPYIPFVFVLTIFNLSDLSAWDMEGHMLAAKNFQDVLFPFISGWNKNNFAGFPQGYLYPSLFHWIIGGLSKLFPLEYTFKAMVSLTVLFLPTSWKYLLDKHGLPSDKMKFGIFLLMVLYFIPKNSMGGEAFGTFFVGLVNQQWAMVFFFFYMGLINRIDEKRNWLWAGVCMGVICLSHAFVLLAAILLSAAYVIGYKAYKSKEKILGWLKCTLLSLGIGCAWWLPYLKFKSYGNGVPIKFFVMTHIWGDAKVSYPLIIAVLIFSLGLLVYQSFILKKSLQSPALKSIKIYMAIILSIGILSEFLFRSSWIDFGETLPIHYYRLHFFWFFGLFVLVTFCEPKVWMTRLGYAVGCLAILAGMKYSQTNFKGEFNVGMRFKPNARVLVSQGPFTTMDIVLPHKLSTYTQQSGYETINGLFVESAKHSSFYMSTLYALFTAPFTWGVRVIPYNIGNIKDYLDLLGINTLFAKTPLPNIIKENLPITQAAENLKAEEFFNAKMKFEYFHAYIFDVDFAHTFSDYQVVTNLWDDRVESWWSSRNEIQKTLIDSPEQLAQKSQSNQKVTVPVKWNHPFSFTIKAPPEKNWIKVKESYFENWKAFSKAKEVPIYRCSPYMMCVFGEGEITFKYIRSMLEKVSHIVSLLSISFVILSLLWRSKFLISGLLLFPLSVLAAPEKLEQPKADAVYAGAMHTCMQKKQEIKCWGYNQFYQLGNAKSSTARKRLSFKHDLRSVSGMALGFAHTCIWNKTKVKCLGKNLSGQLGRGFVSVKEKQLIPVKLLPKNSEIQEVKAFASNTCVYYIFQKRYYLRCFGKIWEKHNHSYLYELSGKMDSWDIGEAHLCFHREKNVYCAGENHFHQLGHKKQGSEFSKVEFDFSQKEIVTVSTGTSATCVLTQAKTKAELVCFGENQYFQLGLLDQKQLLKPTPFSLAGARIQDLKIGYTHSCILSDGNLYCFGSNLKRESHPKKKRVFPITLRDAPVLKEIDHFNLGLNYTCASSNGYFSCFGIQDSGKD